MNKGETFVGQFVKYMRTRTDCPPQFHMHAALACLSVALGNRVYTDGPTRDIYPNIWSVVIAPSGYGKSAPLDMAQRLITLAGLGEAVLPSSFSQEGLFDQLTRQPVGIFVPQEFAAFLGVLSREYNAGAMETLTDLFDVPDEYTRVLRTSTVKLTLPALTVLGASSPDWFAQQYKASMLRGGFLARFLFCPSKESGPVVDDPGPRDRELEQELAEWLAYVSRVRGRAEFAPDVRERYRAWVRQDRLAMRDEAAQDFSGMRSRAATYVKKVAMLFHASRTAEDLTLTQVDLDNAIKFVEHAQAQAMRYLSEEVAHNQDDADRLRILEIVDRAQGRIAWGPAMRLSHMSKFKFENAVATLEDAEQLTVERVPGSKAKWLVRRRLERVA